MLSKEEVRHIAKLARLGLAEKEIEKFQKDLSSIFVFFEKFQEIGLQALEADFYLTDKVGLGQGMRLDEARPQDKETVKDLIESAPAEKDGCLKVKSVF